MSSEANALHMLFFPFMAQGHMPPMVDMSILFASRGANATILTTPANAALVQPSIGRAKPRVGLHVVPFPSVPGLPDGCENASSLPGPDATAAFFEAVQLLREPFAAALRLFRPDCVVSDMFLPWTHDVAAGLGIPRLVFHGTNVFSLCVADSFDRHRLLDALPADAAASLTVPGLPHVIAVPTSRVPDFHKPDGPLAEFFKRVRASDAKSYGVVVNSFYEVEPEYARHYRDVVGRRAWHIGPLALCNGGAADKYAGCSSTSMCLNWLDGQSPGSVVYVCFGSMSAFSPAQLRDIAAGLEASGRPFIFVVRRGDDGWNTDGGRGLIVRGWAPQVLILNHPSVGGFVTHCGWNSSLEGISAGLPLATWPLFAEQIYNEMLIVDVLGIGVAVGANEYRARSAEEREVVPAGKVERAVGRLMGGGEEAEGRRRRARELGEKARRAVEEGGASYVDVGNLIQELRGRKRSDAAESPAPVEPCSAVAGAAVAL